MTAAKKVVFIGLKHGNWYLMERYKNMVGDSTKDGEGGGGFPGDGRDNEQIFG